jgi:hypothetical protein
MFHQATINYFIMIKNDFDINVKAKKKLDFVSLVLIVLITILFIMLLIPILNDY